METHVQEENVSSVLGPTALGWRFDTKNDQTVGGRIWLLWKPEVFVVVYLRTDKLIICGVTDPATGTSCTVCFVYAHNT